MWSLVQCATPSGWDMSGVQEEQESKQDDKKMWNCETNYYLI